MSDASSATLARIEACAAGSEPRAARARKIAGEIRGYRGYRWVGVYDVDDAGVSILGWNGGGAPAYPRFPRTDGLTGRAIARAEIVVVNDVASEPNYLEAFGDTRAEVIVPVVVDGRVVGTIDVESGERGAFGDADSAFLERSGAAATALWRDGASGARGRSSEQA